MTDGFTIVRTYDATPEEVWAAWTDPDRAAQWWHPREVTTPRDSVAIDARAGGRYTYTMVRDDSGEQFPTTGVYREVVPFERLVFTWGSPDDDPDQAPVVTLTFEPVGDATRLTFELRGAEHIPDDVDVRGGWGQALDVLAEYLDGAAEAH